MLQVVLSWIKATPALVMSRVSTMPTTKKTTNAGESLFRCSVATDGMDDGPNLEGTITEPLKSAVGTTIIATVILSASGWRNLSEAATYCPVARSLQV